MPFIQITVTVPKTIINVEGVRREIIQTQNTVTVRKLRDLFHRTVEGWHNPPSFDARRRDTSQQLGVFVYPGGPNADQYALVNEGARPHIIRPRKARFLRFQVGYRAGTRPHIIGSTTYRRFGEFVRKPIVHHPGFEAREFTQAIADRHEPEFERDMNEAIARGARP